MEELEAVNHLNPFRMTVIVRKYEHIAQLIPLQSTQGNVRKVYKDEEDESDAE